MAHWTTPLPATRYDYVSATVKRWIWSSGRPSIPGGHALNPSPTAAAYLFAVVFVDRTTPYIDLHLSTSDTTDVRADLSAAFESGGKLGITVGTTRLVTGANADTAEPYRFSFADDDEFDALFALLGNTDGATAGSLTVWDGAGTDPFADADAPTFSSATTNAAGTAVVITFSENLDDAHVPAPAAFNVQVAGARRNVAASGVAIDDDEVTLTLASAVTAGQTVTVAYTQPAAGQASTRLQNAAGDEVATFAAQAVTNAVPAPSELPFTVTLSSVFALSTSAQWSGSVPASKLTSATAGTLDVTITGSSNALDINLPLNVEFLSDIETDGKIVFENASGTVLFERNVGQPIHANYGGALTASETTALLGVGSGNLVLRFELASQPIDATPAGVSVPAPTATARAEAADPTAVDAEIAASVPAPTATARAEAADPTGVDVSIAAAVPAPTATARPEVAAGGVIDAEIAASVPAPTATARAEAADPTPVDAEIAASVPAPTATARAEAADPTGVDVSIAAAVPAPTATARPEVATGGAIDAEIAASVPAPTATARAEAADPTPVDVSIAAAVPAPNASAQAEPHELPVDATPAAVSVPPPTATAQAEPHELPVDAEPAAISVPAPAATSPRAEVRQVFPADARPAAVSVPAPTATARVEAATLDFRAQEAASAPIARILTYAEFRHPALSEPLRAVNDTEDHVIGGETYTATRFEAKLADDAKRRAPRAEISVGNVGRQLSAWVEQSGGGAGGTVRLFQGLVGSASPDWELTLDVMGITGDSQSVRVSLGYDPLLGRPAVALRYDPQTAPGLF